MHDSGTTPSSGTAQANLWGMLCHLSALAGFFIPFGNLIGPILVWQLKKRDFPSVDDQGKESVNFQLSILLYLLVSMVLMLVGIGFLLVVAVSLFALVMVVLASLKANQGIAYRYPLKIQWIK